ncbi:MAG TPA: phosphoenolpyruvate synthase [Gammaproteobacteria bacterium]|nr:phosphoenolpyruvate synthase [Gammaproteobacteria bacterium]
MAEYIIWFDHLGMDNVPQVGGKNASLGEMISNLKEAGVRVPGGFATTAHAYREFLRHDRLGERIKGRLDQLDVDDVHALAEAGAEIRQWIIDTPFPEPLRSAITAAYRKMEEQHGGEVAVAVRSSATAEDLPDASFAGQQETFLNIRGLEDVIHAVHHVFASLFNDRAIAYRVHKDFKHDEVALSAGIQGMVRSDLGSSGVMFTMDTESGFDQVVFVTGAYGLGETVVQGSVNPDEFYVHKPTLAAGKPAVLSRTLGGKAIQMVYNDGTENGETIKTIDVPEADRKRFCLNDAQLEELARNAVAIEQHYGRPMDVEWALDGEDNRLYIVQARPETVKSQERGVVERYKLNEKGDVLCSGRAIGQRIGQGPARVVGDVKDMYKVEAGDVLVTDMTDPDWEPVMKRASAIVTNRGGRTCHAAIIARELGIPAVVGCHDATERLKEGQEVTISCVEGDTGNVYAGLLDFEIEKASAEDMPELPMKVMMNVGNPGLAFNFTQLPNHGVGLARLEFIINTMIGVHPRALLEFDQQKPEIQAAIRERTAGYDDPVSFYVDKIAEGVSMLAAAFYPEPVIVRLSDFKSNEYANLLAGSLYEPQEENPMIGFRGASRYLSDTFRPCFELECKALKRVRDDMGLNNVQVMVPFVRTVDEAKGVEELLAANGLKRGENALKVIMMCEIPSNAVLAEQFLEHFDGFSIGSNDLTQLTLGLDRDSDLVAQQFDERNAAVKAMLEMAIGACRKQDKYVGICGQGPSDYPELAQWLMDQGISSVSLNPDTVVETWLELGGKKL